METLLLMLLAVALVATAATLITGVAAMAYGGRFDEAHSHHLMAARLAAQGIAILLALLILLTRLG
jgi:hypothetical protein